MDTVIFPVTFSDADGVKVTVIVALCPAAKVRGVVMPLVVKSFALTVTCEMVALVFPLLVMVTFCALELPT